MANEDMEYETIIRETEAPSRANGRDKKGIRIAKLTSRTIDSLRTNIKEKRLARAYRKYNEKYAKMRRALREANELRNSYDNGENVTQSQVVEAYDIVATYERKLSKYAVKLLTDDIKTAVADKKPKPIRVPRILLGKLRPITKAIMGALEKRKTKKLQKSLVKEMKGATRDYIEGSLEGALFKDSTTGVLRERVDADVIKGLATDKSADTFEEKIANLRRFISADGKTPLYGEDEIGIDKPGTNLPPAEPTASVEKTTQKIDIDALTKGLSTKKEEPVEPKVDTVVEEKPAVTIGTLTDGLGAKPKSDEKDNTKPSAGVEPVGEVISSDSVVELSDEDKKTISKRKREVSSIISLGKSIKSLENQLGNVSDPETRASIEAMIETLNGELKNIIDRSLKTGKQVSVDEPVVDKKVETGDDLSVVEIPDTVKEEPTPEKKSEKPSVTITSPDLGRVSQSGEPSTLVVTPNVLAEMQRRNEAAKAKIASLTTEIENLREQKALYEKYIEVASATRDNERTVSELSATRNATATEVEELASTAAAINAEVGSRFVQKR